MTEEEIPKIGDWYKNQAGDTFEVVAYDEGDETIEIQYFDGAVEEIDMDTWIEEAFEQVEPPEDWSGSYDIQQEDYGVDLENQPHIDHTNPLDKV